MSSRPPKAILCFHGTGSKGDIFHVQMARICSLMKENFEFIFLDGPLETSTAGPGVLPTFAGQQPYYCWFAGEGTTIDQSMVTIASGIKQTIDHWKAERSDPHAEVVGAIGFSEGALALACLLWQRQLGLVPWLSQLRFAAMCCCFFPNEASLWLKANAESYGISEAHINTPTLHIHGNRDFCLGRARKLVRNHYQPEFATVLQVDGGHHMPKEKNQIEEILRHLLRLSEVSTVQICS